MTVPRATTFDVRIWKTEKYTGAKVTTYTVRWNVAGKARRKSFRTAAMAESFRSGLVTAARTGEAFDVATGRPASELRNEASSVSWYAFACEYVDLKWPRAAAKYRKSIAEALTTVTASMLTAEPADSLALRSALAGWAFNSRQRAAELPAAVKEQLDWVAGHTRPVVDLNQPAVIRRVLDGLATKLDGSSAAPNTLARKRAVLANALGYAVERELLPRNPIETIAWKAPRASVVVDRRSVLNPDQARALLAALEATPRSGSRLRAFFAVMYYAALRPEEAVDLRQAWLDLPKEGWGWISVDRAAPDAGKVWTDSGRQRDDRQLKHRAVGEARRVPCPPELTAILHDHLRLYGTDPSGRLFVGERGGELATITYTRVWARARDRAFTPEQYESRLARRPYDLRHAAVSTWLSAGVSPSQVAAWAGHGVDVLLRIYAKCIDGQEAAALRRIQSVLGAASMTSTGLVG